MDTTRLDAAELDKAVAAGTQSAILVDRSELGVLKITGETRLDLIHRMSTQAVNGLKSGEGTATVLTTDIGRIIDRLLLYATSDAVYAVTGENSAERIARHLMSYVFFNDDFHIEDLSAQTAVFAVYGPEAQAKLEELLDTELDIPLHHWRQVTRQGQTLYVHKTDPVHGGGFFLMVAADEKQAVWNDLTQAGFTPGSEAAFEYLRVESGLPRAGHELTNDYIPLETGLWDDVSFSKGCYIGQEIIARMESRGRIAKKLAGLRPQEPIPVGSEIQADGRNVGTVTSVADGPRGPVALGYVKTAVLESEESKLYAGDVPLRLRTLSLLE